MSEPARFDVAIVGAGAAGLHCAALAGQRGLSAVLIDHAVEVAEKIRISGGGRCNFTNRQVGPEHFDSANADYCRSALARYTPQDFVALVDRHRIAWHEKHRGQLFCDGSSRQIVAMLLAECAAVAVSHWQPCTVTAVERRDGRFALWTTRGGVEAGSLVVATGGLSIPKIGATDFGYRIARQFGHYVVEPRPALVPFECAADDRARFAALAGVSLPVRMAAGAGAGRRAFAEDLLFTHRGLSGPAALQASTYWRPGEAVMIDAAPGRDLAAEALDAKRRGVARQVAAWLGERMPRRFVDAWLAAPAAGPAASAAASNAASSTPLAPAGLGSRPLADCRDRDLAALARSLHGWPLVPSGTEGWRKAEVTAGGVDTRGLDSRNGESRLVPGLHFIGEVVDVTGWLGGYNFQWAWASAAACAGALAVDRRARSDILAGFTENPRQTS